MKNYIITVNGNTYNVQVEEAGAAATQSMPQTSAPVMPKAQASAPAAPKAAAGAMGSVKIEAPMPGKILAVKKQAGEAVKTGDVVVILEAMKMENEIVASCDGTVASINVAVGDTVEAAQVLATLN